MRLHDADAGAADERAEQSDERRGRDRESVLRIVVVVKEYIEGGRVGDRAEGGKDGR